MTNSRRDLRVRPYEDRDAAPLAALYRRSVEQVGLRDYSAEQVAAWVSLAPSAERLSRLALDGRVRLVAVAAQDRAVAFADLEADGHIQFLYCAPEAVGQGVGSALYDALEEVALARGLPRLFSEASEAARRLFVRKGFTVTARRDFEVAGVAIHNYAVEKALTETAAD